MYGTGFLPTEESNLYRLDERDGHYLTGTSEVALAALHMGEILEGAAAPLRRLLDQLPPRGRRRRQGHARHVPRPPVRQGRDVRLIAPEESRAEHERLLAIEEELVGELGFPYRVVDIPIGDLGAPAARKFDIEAWFPTQERYREITSCSNTTDYQASRLEIRYRPGGKGTASVHTLNGTAVDGARDARDHGELPGRAGAIAVPPVLVEFGAPGTARSGRRLRRQRALARPPAGMSVLRTGSPQTPSMQAAEARPSPRTRDPRPASYARPVRSVILAIGGACALVAFAAAGLFFVVAARQEGYSEGTPGQLGGMCLIGGIAILAATYFLARALRRR